MNIQKVDCYATSRYAYEGIDKDGHKFYIDISFGKNERLAKSLKQDKVKDYIFWNAQYVDEKGESWAYTKKSDPAIIGCEGVKNEEGRTCRYNIVKMFEHTPENVARIVKQLTGCTINKEELPCLL